MINDRHKQDHTSVWLKVEAYKRIIKKKHEDDDLLYTLLDLEPLLATLASISRTYLSTYVHIAVESREEKRDSVTSAFIHSPLNQQQIKKMPMKKNFCLQTQYLWMTKTN